MLKSVAQFFSKVIKTPSLRKKILITGVVLIIFRLAGASENVFIQTLNPEKELFENIKNIYMIDQSPIGRTPR